MYEPHPPPPPTDGYMWQHLLPIYTLSPLVPGPVADLKVAASTFTTVILQWRPPLHPNGIITSYKVSIINQSLGQQIVTSVNVHVLSLTLFNLPLLSKHNISVFACTSKGAGVQSYIVGSTAIVRTYKISINPWGYSKCLAPQPM